MADDIEAVREHIHGDRSISARDALSALDRIQAELGRLRSKAPPGEQGDNAPVWRWIEKAKSLLPPGNRALGVLEDVEMEVRHLYGEIFVLEDEVATLKEDRTALAERVRAACVAEVAKQERKVNDEVGEGAALPLLDLVINLEDLDLAQLVDPK